MRKWLVLHTKSSRERQVMEALEARGIETYWPVFSGVYLSALDAWAKDDCGVRGKSRVGSR